MYRITVTVTPERELAAHMRLSNGSLTVYDDWAAASADPKCAARQGNPSLDPLRPGGHPPLGHYELVAQGTPPAGTENEYGRTLLLFEPVRGPALDAEAYGRLALLVYAGRMAPDSKLRRTQGGLRLSSTAMDYLLVGLGDDTPVELHIELAEPPPWWAFWRKARVHPPLSARPPEFTASPTDEATLMTALMQNLRKRRAPLRPTKDDDHERRREREDRRDSRSSTDDSPEFRGRGGEGGGAGASGGWSDAPAAGRGPGVDAAGRIIATAGVAAVAAAAVMATRDDAQASDAPSASTSDNATTPTTTESTASESAGASSESSWSSSSTSY